MAGKEQEEWRMTKSAKIPVIFPCMMLSSMIGFSNDRGRFGNDHL
jgi:uncharacterized metal-binding protein